METINLIVDEKVTLWERSYVSVEAESLKDAVKKYLDGKYDVNDSESLYDTVEYLRPSEQDPVTIEIFEEDDDNTCIYSNSLYIRE